MIDFLSGGFYTLGVIIFGIIIGYTLGAREEKLEQRRAKMKAFRQRIRNRGQESGSVKPKVVTNADADALERKPFEDRFAAIGAVPTPPGNSFIEP